VCSAPLRSLMAMAGCVDQVHLCWSGAPHRSTSAHHRRCYIHHSSIVCLCNQARCSIKYGLHCLATARSNRRTRCASSTPPCWSSGQTARWPGNGARGGKASLAPSTLSRNSNSRYSSCNSHPSSSSTCSIAQCASQEMVLHVCMRDTCCHLTTCSPTRTSPHTSVAVHLNPP
jgi:hypothetical protein